MMARIRNWYKIIAGSYGSDQRVFDTELGSYISKYLILQSGNSWDIKLWDKDACKYQTIGNKETLKSAKKFAEDHFGIQDMETDFDKAMKDGGRHV